MKKTILSLVVGLGILLVGENTGFAAEDQTIKLNTGQNLQLPSFYDFSYNTQENVHYEFTNVSGVKVDHFYFIIEVDGTKIIAVDPPTTLF